MQPEKIGPPKVELEDTRLPAPGHGRQVRCHQCGCWVAWQFVAEKGAIEGNPVAGDLECWQCYIQRVDTNLTWGKVKPLYKQGKKLKEQKRKFDVLNAESIAFEIE